MEMGTRFKKRARDDDMEATDLNDDFPTQIESNEDQSVEDQPEEAVPVRQRKVKKKVKIFLKEMM